MAVYTYRKNETDRQIDQFVDSKDDSCIRVETGDGKARLVNSPQTGAAENMVKGRQGQVLSFGDKPQNIESKAGKARKHDDSPPNS
jgi:hypothetical protein